MFPVPAPEPSPAPLWQRLPQAGVEQTSPAVASKEAHSTAASGPQAIAPEAGLTPGNFTRSTPPLEPQAAPGRKQRRGSSRGDRRWGVLFGALFFIGLALAGAGWFFQDQVKIYWGLAMARLQSTDAPDASGTDPDVAALLKNVKVATGPGGGQRKPEVASTDSKEPAPAVKPAGGDTASPKGPVSAPPQTAVNTKPEPAAPEKLERESNPVIAGAVTNTPHPSASPQVETTKPPGIPSAPTSEPPKAPSAVAPEVSSDPPAKKALPVDSDEAPMKSPNRDLPETISPVPPGPRTPATPALVEVPPSAKGAASAAPGEDKPVFVKANADAKPAADVLNQFFQAKTWQERLLFTQPQEKLRPLMERYYADNPDGPLRVSSIELIRHEKTPEIGTPLCIFQVSGPDIPEPLPVMVESSPDGWKVDWLTLMEFKGKLLLRYLQKWQDEPARFHVMVRRTHYFDEDVPALDSKHCFELMPPTPGYSGYAFVPKGSPLAQNLDRNIGWEVANVAAVVELRWRKQDRYQWVEITAVPQFNWRSALPAIPVAQADKSSPESDNGAVPAKPASSGKPPAVAEKK